MAASTTHPTRSQQPLGLKTFTHTNLRTRLIHTAMLLFLCGFGSLPLHADEWFWNGATDDFTSANWSVNGATMVAGPPPAGSSVIIGSGEATLTTNSDLFERVKISGTGILIVAAGGTLNISNTLSSYRSLEISSTTALLDIKVGGSVIIDALGTSATGLWSMGSISNRGDISINVPSASTAAMYLIDGVLTNRAAGNLVVQQTDKDGIFSLGTINNAGTISVEQAGSDGIWQRGVTTNNGTIQVSTANTAITIDSTFTNNPTGKIYIGSLDGVVGTISSTGMFFSEHQGQVINKGLIQIDHHGGTGLTVFHNNVINEGSINVTYEDPIQQNTGLFAAPLGKLTNAKCATIRTVCALGTSSDGQFANEGSILIDTDQTSTFSPTVTGLINKGRIQDAHNSLNLSSPTILNDGYILQSISTDYSGTDVILDVLQGNGANITVSPDVYVAPTGPQVVGIYDEMDNTITFTKPASICNSDRVYISLDDGNGCPLRMAVRFEHPLESTLCTCYDGEFLALQALYQDTDGDNWTSNTNWSMIKTETSCPDGFDVNDAFGITTDDLGRIEKIDLTSNNLLGVLSEEIGQIPALKELVLQDNDLSGAIPGSIGGLGQLEILNLNVNGLSGPLPPEIWQLSQLKELRLSLNSLSGTISSDIAQLDSLKVLELGINNLSGSIPAELTNLELLERLSLSSNDFSGSIPTTLGEMTTLSFLSLSGNNLTGSIPPELGQLSNLTTLSLSRNNLSGTIPSELGNIDGLLALYLAQNNLTGSIPAAVGNLASLSILDVSDNLLSGCYAPELLALCGNPNIADSDISDGNNFDAPWSSFCDTNLGMCITCGTLTWTGSIDNDWHNPNNWTPAQIPIPCNEISIGSSAIINILSGSTGQGQTIDIQQGAEFTIEGLLDIEPDDPMQVQNQESSSQHK